jgi:hypothetical protein
MMSDKQVNHDYTNERVVGHHLRANRESYEPYSSLFEDSDLSIAPLPEKIRIVEGDVDWDDTRQVCLMSEELREMALTFTDLTEDE